MDFRTGKHNNFKQWGEPGGVASSKGGPKLQGAKFDGVRTGASKARTHPHTLDL